MIPPFVGSYMYNGISYGFYIVLSYVSNANTSMQTKIPTLNSSSAPSEDPTKFPVVTPIEIPSLRPNTACIASAITYQTGKSTKTPTQKPVHRVMPSPQVLTPALTFHHAITTDASPLKLHLLFAVSKVNRKGFLALPFRLLVVLLEET